MAVFEADWYDSRYQYRFRGNPETDFYSYCGTIPRRLQDMGGRGNWDKHRQIFYDLMWIRKAQPDLYVPEELALLAANVIYDEEPKGVILTDWKLLPAALLLAGKDIPVRLPDDAPQELAALFSAPTEDCVTLGWDLGKHLKEQPEFMDQLRDGSVFLCPREFLTSQRDENVRRRLLEAKKLYAAMRLPKAGFDRWSIYSALLLIHSEAEEIRLPRAGSFKSMNAQDAMLDCLRDRSSPRLSVIKALQTGRIALPENDFAGIPLRNIADVIRCQLPRKKCPDFIPASGTDADDKVKVRIAKEYSLADLDPLTGILDPAGGSYSEVDLTKATDISQKSFLRKHDILMVFRGAEESIGKVGLCPDLPEDSPGIPNRAFCIIRAKTGIEPVFLYYALRKTGIAEAVQAAGSGQKSLIVSLDAIRDLTIRMPTETAQREIRSEHHSIIRSRRHMEAELRNIKKSLAEIERLEGE